jgi:hypothetical protein
MSLVPTLLPIAALPCQTRGCRGLERYPAMLLSKAYLPLRLALVWIRYATLYSIRVSSVVLVVTVIGTVVFSNTDISLFPRLAMHPARTPE